MSYNATAAPSFPGALPGPRNRTLAILLVSVLGLFLEMMLIRWVSTEVRIFAYLQNTVLVVCFLGLGMGCFTCRQPISARHLLLPCLVLVVLLAVPLTRDAAGKIGNWLSVLDDLVIWSQEHSASPWEGTAKVGVGLLFTFALMVLLWEVFVPLGRLLGRLLDDHPHTIRAYSVNVAGSLLGIWSFALLSSWYLPPGAWALACGLLLVPFLGTGRERLVNLGLVAAIVAGCWAAGHERGALNVVWSPYQKLALFDIDNRHPSYAGKYMITVNNASYQGIIDLGEEGLAENHRIPKEQHGLSQYDLPLRFRPGAERVLIVGAGSGNDVAGALRGGAAQVTAVEIDPAIVALGRQHHPERPYHDGRVRVVIDDARSFFATTPEKYDLVVFGLLDSHTTTAMTNARLDHYVYTLESLRHVRSLLSDDGVIVLSFEVHKPYIADRMSRALTEVFGRAPLTFWVPASGSGWGGAFFVTGSKPAIDRALADDPRLAGQVARWQTDRPLELPHTAAITTDDWPYVYLQRARVPTLYWLLGVLLLGLVGYARFRLGGEMPSLTRWHRSCWHFFFLGAAFMLLEVQNISKASVVLGNTWQVNGVIVSGVLCMILLSNLLVALWPRVPLAPVGVCLVGSCLALYFFDLSRLAFLNYEVKALLVGALTTLPMFFSGILFIRSFASAGRRDLALGANLLGALVGGLIQSVTFVTGVKALLLIVAGLYLAALLAWPRQSAVEGVREEEAEGTGARAETVALPS
jgi:spermidine synthase